MKVVFKKDDEDPGKKKRDRNNPIEAIAIQLAGRWRRADRKKAMQENKEKIDQLRKRNPDFLK
jgi:hypothetical protein